MNVAAEHLAFAAAVVVSEVPVAAVFDVLVHIFRVLLAFDVPDVFHVLAAVDALDVFLVPFALGVPVAFDVLAVVVGDLSVVAA